MKNFKFSGVDTVMLAEKYGTPLYIMSEDLIRARLNEIKDSFLYKYDNTMAVYASKAFLTREMARILKDEGIGMDVVSGGELFTALSVDFPTEKIIFHGNNKSVDELQLAVDNNVGRLVIDSIDELELLNEIATAANKTVNILFRISPGIESDTHKYIQTAQLDSKFGIPLNKNQLDESFKSLIGCRNLNFLGFHFHIGSQLSDNGNHIKAIGLIFDLMEYVKREYNLDCLELNTGGGYGIKYTDEKPKPLAYFVDRIMEEVSLNVDRHNLIFPKVIIEPGRWVVGESGMTLYQIGSIKEIPSIRTYVSIDGGMPDNIRPSLYQAIYDGILINKPDEKKEKLVTIAGKCCESGDILIWDLQVPKTIERGDYLGVFSTGAYNYSMASNYNRTPRPPVVMLRDGKDRLVVRRESYLDLIRNDL